MISEHTEARKLLCSAQQGKQQTSCTRSESEALTGLMRWFQTVIHTPFQGRHHSSKLPVTATIVSVNGLNLDERTVSRK